MLPIIMTVLGLNSVLWLSPEVSSELPCTMLGAQGQVIRTSRGSQILNISRTLNIELRLHFLLGNQNTHKANM